MAPGVIIEDDRGVEAMLEHWRLVSISQPNFEIKVVRLENGPDSSIIATTKINIIMCKSMLQHTFPNLDKFERGRRLAAKLLGQPFEINGSIQFNWDNEKSCMLSLQHKSDVMMPIIRFLGDLDDVAFIFDQQYSRLLARRLLAPSA
ncbi:hypothetical protein PHYSODRAFT_307262 [Phytophthora sojae]|uniref:Uncharacterized protein n=1 Tax=Phytophthora sojae (strain P6497) TaxID=1094619 RepID=G5ADL7_PHYSP|nr:hypothetical protein PHYSODRAFT_307262 [Phytophthora sojae]EGZ06270.1 hypothetical protein PHYSODRAFT_307262 [Phytophthora sojae]|eukprot:XP_009538167.1 hypothetical protein PHYSODRAFT_307262 [Phytophthora sojae]